MNQFTKSTLPNGVRVLTDSSDAFQSTSIGLWCVSGSKDETESEAGISHFIEHMLFKGTKKRTARVIAEEIEGRGGDLNAFTDKEITCYYCRVLDQDTAVGIEVLADMLANSSLDQKDLDLERGVILEEISRAFDEPSSHVHDLHVESRWGQHALGKPVIGTKESVSAIQPDDMRHYIKRRFRGNRVLLAVSGNCQHEAINDLASDLLGHFESGVEDTHLASPEPNFANQSVEKDCEAVHFCIGVDGLKLGDDRNYTLAVLDTALGGNMSSRLFQEVREKRGLVYSIGSYSLSYSTAGLLTVYGGTSPTNWDQVKELVLQEFAKITKDGLTQTELERLKKNIAGNMILRLEGLQPRMNRMVRNELIYGRYLPTQEILEKINAVTLNNVQEMAKQLFDPSKVSITTIGPMSKN